MALYLDGSYAEGAAVDTAASRGVNCTSNASANTKASSFTTLIASTLHNAVGLLVSLVNGGTTVPNMSLTDIAVGAASSENVIIPNLLANRPTSDFQNFNYFFPIEIPAGTRISARTQDTTGSTRIDVQVIPIYAGFNHPIPLGWITDMGTDTTNSRGTPIDPGGSANTLGSWTQIVASTTHDIKLLIAAFHLANNAALTAGTWLIDIGIGAGGSEQVIIPQLLMVANNSRNMAQPSVWPPFPIFIPAGTRIAIRAQSTITDATDRKFDAALYGVS